MVTNTKISAFSLDDFEARTGSATSIIRTITGLYLRHQSASVPRTQVVELATAAGVPATTAQTAISRLIDKQVLDSDSPSTLCVPSPAQAMFERGSRRIFTPRQMSQASQWCLVAYSLPEALRPLRHQIRKHFQQLGGGLVAAGLWIFPEYLHEEVEAVLVALQARAQATIFTVQEPHFPTTAKEAASQWWDLDHLNSLHRQFLEATADLAEDQTQPAEAYRGYVSMIDAWRALPYLDPGLPESMLPDSWSGRQSRDRFLALSQVFKDPAQQFVTSVLGS
ncbi:PaaX family transcriptional regulator C-terminal domain-containing protein [Glutamicibacter ectropisis]|uniref:PaaX family transcriptional regulator C-terminal domain-containing protein n=1 Tax=Glutamicibacter ectropisis TaxID=3046593 RepID=A0AAU6WF63_9MICC